MIYDPAGYALTNYHVVAGAGKEGWGGIADGKLYRWKLIGMDPGGDVAIIKLEGRETFPFSPIGNSDHVRIGDFTLAMGNPFILAEDQYAVGEVIELNGKGATVERLTLRSTTLRDFNGYVHFVPNGEIKTVTNRSRGWNRLAVDVPIGSDQDHPRALATIRTAVASLNGDPTWRVGRYRVHRHASAPPVSHCHRARITAAAIRPSTRSNRPP